jgi:hypothetical protein
MRVPLVDETVFLQTAVGMGGMMRSSDVPHGLLAVAGIMTFSISVSSWASSWAPTLGVTWGVTWGVTCGVTSGVTVPLLAVFVHVKELFFSRFS